MICGNVYIFKDDDIEGTINVSIKSISAYGIQITEFTEVDDTQIPTRAVVWINTGAINFNRNVTYDDAINIEKEITEAINLIS